MAENITPCDCVPYLLQRCCGPINGIFIVQPKCQHLPDGRVVKNPFFDPDARKSYWSYKFITMCKEIRSTICAFLIPICSAIAKQNIVVKEKINGCGEYTDVDFEFIGHEPTGRPTPIGFKWLKVKTEGRFSNCVCVEYRLEIVGNFPVAVHPIKVKTGHCLLTFYCNGGFLVPKCNTQAALSLSKDCSKVIENNEATLKYNLTVSNIGFRPLTNVSFKDVINIPNELSFDNIFVTPSSLTVNTLLPGEIIINGDLGPLDSGDTIDIAYNIPITSIAIPGEYIINNTAKASATGTETTISCINTLNVSQINTTKCCRITGPNTGEFEVSFLSVGQSPSTTINVFKNIFIPDGVTLRFNNFDGCIATFTNTDGLVPINTDIVGPSRINITCNNLTIPSGVSIKKIIKFTVVSSSAFQAVPIKNTVESVTPAYPERQVFLSTVTFPVETDVTVQLSLNCTKPCSF